MTRRRASAWVLVCLPPLAIGCGEGAPLTFARTPAVWSASPSGFTTAENHAPTPFFVDPNIPPDGLDTEWKQLVDGSGVPAPVHVRLKFVYPSPGASIDPAAAVDGFGPPSRVFHYVAEACMDPVPNPTETPFLNSVRVRAYWSADGITSISPSRDSGAGDSGGGANGQCVVMRRIPPEWGGTHGEQWVFFDPPGATHLMFAAQYGSDIFTSWNSTRPTSECPSAEQIASSPTRPACLLRSAHFLNYQWAPGALPEPAVSYDGEWTGSGSGTSSAGMAARATVTFSVTGESVSPLRVTLNIDTAPGTSPSTCSTTSGFATRVVNGGFSLAGGIVYPMTVGGTFTSATTLTGTIQFTPGPTTPPYCQAATLSWTATRR